MTFLKVKALNKYYPLGDKQKFHALKDIQLSFDKGELVSIIGESGSGKSTLVQETEGIIIMQVDLFNGAEEIIARGTFTLAKMAKRE